MRDWPIDDMRRMREGGATWRAIGEAFGCGRTTAFNLVMYGKSWPQSVPKDPGPPGLTLRGESPEQRAFRRFPITEHKPRYG
jgi:hypothetical protein